MYITAPPPAPNPLNEICFFGVQTGKFPGSTGADPGFFLGGGALVFLLYFNTNKPQSFFVWQNTSCVRKPQVISGWGGGGAHPLHPPPRSAPAPK